MRHAAEALEHRTRGERKRFALRRAIDAAAAQKHDQHIFGMGAVQVVAADSRLVHHPDAEALSRRRPDRPINGERNRQITGKHIQLPQRTYFIPRKA
ncbi:hypothetical protein SDC9_172821 [bioreactor metagenome]|uniref:Uncharacterized protein n=1 Tax=bioreactor metagenome TaxID=1076179 RepID=A0A645GHF3_9ZZZZ